MFPTPSPGPLHGSGLTEKNLLLKLRNSGKSGKRILRKPQPYVYLCFNFFSGVSGVPDFWRNIFKNLPSHRLKDGFRSFRTSGLLEKDFFSTEELRP